MLGAPTRRRTLPNDAAEPDRRPLLPPARGAAKVAAYAEDNGFDDIRFAVMTPELLAAMSDAFGKSAINPPSTPHVWVGAEGKVGELATGDEDATKLAAGLDASMMHG